MGLSEVHGASCWLWEPIAVVQPCLQLQGCSRPGLEVGWAWGSARLEAVGTAAVQALSFIFSLLISPVYLLLLLSQAYGRSLGEAPSRRFPRSAELSRKSCRQDGAHMAFAYFIVQFSRSLGQAKVPSRRHLPASSSSCGCMEPEHSGTLLRFICSHPLPWAGPVPSCQPLRSLGGGSDHHRWGHRLCPGFWVECGATLSVCWQGAQLLCRVEQVSSCAAGASLAGADWVTGRVPFLCQSRVWGSRGSWADSASLTRC